MAGIKDDDGYLEAADIVGTANAPTTGDIVRYVKLDLGATGASSPVAGSLPITTGLADTVSAAGSVTAPTLGLAVATIAAPGAGVYKVVVTTFQTGTVDTTKPANCELRHGATVVQASGLLTTPVAATATFERVTVLAGEAITVNATAAGAAGSVFNAQLHATKVG